MEHFIVVDVQQGGQVFFFCDPDIHKAAFFLMIVKGGKTCYTESHPIGMRLSTYRKQGFLVCGFLFSGGFLDVELHMASSIGGRRQHLLSHLLQEHAGQRAALRHLGGDLCCLVLFFVTSPEKNLFAAWKQVNWTAFAFGLCLVGLEFGYIQLYRAGWSVSVGPLVCNIALACVLLVIGVLLYKETLHLTQVLGMLLCVAGLILVNR